jgi:hypothetical protein
MRQNGDLMNLWENLLKEYDEAQSKRNRENINNIPDLLERFLTWTNKGIHKQYDPVRLGNNDGVRDDFRSLFGRYGKYSNRNENTRLCIRRIL